MLSGDHIRQSFSAALPIMLGYVAIGIPCGILSASIGMNELQVFLLSAVFYSGAGQFMIPNMWLAGSPLASIIASVSLVNTRQMLYSASFAPRCERVKKRLAFLFAATVTDESYGVNTAKFEEGGWSVGARHAREPFLAKLVGAVERGRRARGQRRGHPAGHSLLRHDVHLHLPACHAEGDAGQRGGCGGRHRWACTHARPSGFRAPPYSWARSWA